MELPRQTRRSSSPTLCLPARYSQSSEPFHVSRPHGSSQAVNCFVGPLDQFVSVLEFEDAHHGAKNFFLSNLHLVFHICENGRRDKVSALANAVSSAHKLRAFLSS